MKRIFRFSNQKSIQKLQQALKSSRNIFIFTGAGASVESEIPTFRSAGGLWTKKEMVRLGYIESWIKDPETCWNTYESFRIFVDSKNPGPTHRIIRKLEEKLGARVATTNVDSLHFRCGTSAFEIHGTLRKFKCFSCSYRAEVPVGSASFHPGCPQCGNWLRHDVVLWGESVQRASEYKSFIESADLVLFVGMSGSVTDTGEIARNARLRGAFVVEINPAIFTPATKYTSCSIRMNSDEAFSEIENSLEI